MPKSFALAELEINKIKVLTAWKAVRSEAIVTGDEVLGESCCNDSAWKAVRLWRCKKEHVRWRSAFQAHRPYFAYPRTSSPVTIAALCSAFQALTT